MRKGPIPSRPRGRLAALPDVGGSLASLEMAAASELAELATTRAASFLWRRSNTVSGRPRHFQACSAALRVREGIGPFLPGPSRRSSMHRGHTSVPAGEEGRGPFTDRKAAEEIENGRGFGEDCLSVQGDEADLSPRLARGREFRSRRPFSISEGTATCRESARRPRSVKGPRPSSAAAHARPPRTLGRRAHSSAALNVGLHLHFAPHREWERNGPGPF